jgi:hypothetical protein
MTSSPKELTMMMPTATPITSGATSTNAASADTGSSIETDGDPMVGSDDFAKIMKEVVPDNDEGGETSDTTNPVEPNNEDTTTETAVATGLATLTVVETVLPTPVVTPMLTGEAPPSNVPVAVPTILSEPVTASIAPEKPVPVETSTDLPTVPVTKLPVTKNTEPIAHESQDVTVDGGNKIASQTATQAVAGHTPVQPARTRMASRHDPVGEAGTGSARIEIPMKPTIKTERNAEAAQNNLPRERFLPEPASQRAEAALSRPMPVFRDDRLPRASDVAELRSPAIAAFRSAGGERIEDTVLFEPVRELGESRLVTSVTDHVLAFRRIGAREVDVNIRPDANTEIALHMSLRNGQVEVVARLERGDWQNVQLQWSGLQQQLSLQGIRVGQLAASQDGSQHQSMADHAMQHGFDRHHQQQPFDRSPESLDELPLVGSITEPLRGRHHAKATSSQRRGWEMWA